MEPQSLFERLQGRRMFHWLVVYAALAWGIAEATGFAIDNYGFPRTLLDVVLFLLLVSFFGLIVIVWFHGLRGRQRVTPTEGGLLAVLALIAIGGSLWIAVGRSGAEPALAAEGEVVAELGDDAVAILPFRSSLEDRELAWLARAIPELLSVRFAQGDRFRVVSGQRVFDVLRQLGVAEDEGVPEGLQSRVTRLSGARWALTGSIYRGTDDLTIAATLADNRNGEVRASTSVRGSDVFSLVDEISRDLRSQLGSGTTGDATVAASLTTGDVEAYRAYEEGRRALLHFRYDEAADHFRRAVEIDPSFALAHFRLALALFSTGRTLEASEQLQQARAGLGQVSERDSLFIEGFDGFQRDTTAAIRTLRQLVRLYPDEKEGRILFATQLAATRGPEDPESRRLLTEALRLDPLYSAGYNILAYSYAGTGDFDIADSLIRRYVELEPDEPNPLDSRGEMLEFAGRLEEAREAYLSALRLRPDFVFSLDHLTRLHLRAERPARARDDLAAFLDSEIPEVRVRARLLVGDSYTWEGDLDAAFASYEGAEQEAIDASRPDLRFWPLQDMIRIHLALGRYEEATETAREIRVVQPISGWWITALYDSLARADDVDGMELWKPRVEAELEGNPLTRPNVEIISRLLSVLIAHERGQHELAVSLASELPAHLRPGALTGWPVFRSMIELGMADDLLEALRPITNPTPFTAPRRLVPLVERSALYFQGRAYELRGDTARAIERYQTLVEGMGDGIARLHFLADAPDRLAALGGAH